MSEESNNRIKEAKDRAKFFQTVHVWPLSEELDYNGWLNNFEIDEEREIASHILDFFTYYPTKMVDQMLKASVSKAASIFSKFFTDWDHEHLLNRCVYSFIPGENPSPTDSGNLFTRKLRDELEIPESRIVNFTNLPQVLSNIGVPTPVLLVDDFVGSGAQCHTAWSLKHFQRADGATFTFSQIANDGGHCVVYSPLIVNSAGFKRIKDHCSGLHLTANHVLGPEYDLFDENCFCWKGNKDLYTAGVNLIINKSRELGIPFSDGKNPQDVKGFGEQGLAIAFAHGAPDAIPSFFYWCKDNWTPLIKKTYTR